ncbi:PadR family transcriptional regulator [Paraburkholderia caballeronis]|uniref:DNA-binding transcriptional regulator, PadR family n=1 Tax=Paraburkholderia caballeronis TaxID=416943 RepID=A0A1H7N2D0_9BURK|nr:PadR family transcriptional regulator [Paraburkholderia caballeronis]PXW26319.1 PadR family transcriptional regulator [Paraburkholderia caballeronis]PXX01866.1 PadR family transcriptional regulator [Paraburkholderia caballeronis]RAK01023.1 PadR family transcriptional regulator [Paraburkholderia caballeronis]SEC02303.1 transcriptional regulator, PadR family [Paraburkholderia caballeronis]SEL17105.1 DNA-binding transcriptional regulator, PadR family [Paraburkholderia caballeronis]
MSTPHAILIALLEKPSSGYDLARRFDRAIGYFWRATHQQIYRELGRMVEAGWVAVMDGDALAQASQEALPAATRRKVYRVLPVGRDEVARWVRETRLGVDDRNAFLLKLRADAAIGPLGLGDELLRLIDEHRARLDTYREIEQRDFAGHALTNAQQLQYAILRAGLLQQQTWLEWADGVRPLLGLPASERGVAN